MVARVYMPSRNIGERNGTILQNRLQMKFKRLFDDVVLLACIRFGICIGCSSAWRWDGCDDDSGSDFNRNISDDFCNIQFSLCARGIAIADDRYTISQQSTSLIGIAYRKPFDFIHFYLSIHSRLSPSAATFSIMSIVVTAARLCGLRSHGSATKRPIKCSNAYVRDSQYLQFTCVYGFFVFSLFISLRS